MTYTLAAGGSRGQSLLSMTTYRQDQNQTASDYGGTTNLGDESGCRMSTVRIAAKVSPFRRDE